MEVATLGVRGVWTSIRGSITFGPEVPLTLGGRRGLESDGKVTVAGLAVYAEMSATEARTDGGGEFPSLGFIVRG